MEPSQSLHQEIKSNMNVTLIIKETFRSFYHNIYVNLLLMAEFVICFFLFITILTYYIDIGDNDELNSVNEIEGRKWYAANIDLSDINIMSKIAQEPDGYERLSAFMNELTNNEFMDFITWRSWQDIYVDKSVFDAKVGENKYENFVPEDYFTTGDYIDDENSSIYVKSVQLNYQAYKYLNIKLSDGDGWNVDNLVIDSSDNKMPILLGADYKNYFDIGDEILIYLPDMSMGDWSYHGYVVGFIEAGQWIPTTEAGKDVQTLDDQIVCPVGMKITYVPDTQELRMKYAYSQFSEAISASHIAVKDGHTYEEAIQYCNKLSEKYDVYKLYFSSMSFGMTLLKNETDTTIQVFTMMTILIIIFTIFCLIATAANRIQSNMRVYAIYIANGSSIANIVVPYILEMLILFIPACCINWWLIKMQIGDSFNYMPLIVLFISILFIYMVVCLLLVVKLSSINIESIMRRKE